MDDGARSYRRFLDGDESAFDEIVESLFYNLIYFVNGIVHDYHAAEDISMDALAELLVNRKRYNFRVSLKTYLFVIGKNKALNYLKHRSKIETVDIEDVQDVMADEERLEDIVLADERRRSLHSAMMQLPEEMRRAVHLIWFEGMSYEEAAKVMGKSKKQLYNMVFRSKEELRTILGKEAETVL